MSQALVAGRMGGAVSVSPSRIGVTIPVTHMHTLRLEEVNKSSVASHLFGLTTQQEVMELILEEVRRKKLFSITS